jgi:predicted Zn-dependent peptidase
MGAEFNAFTDKEYCCIYADFIDVNLPECMGLLLDIICNPSFHSPHIKTEKKVILEEIRMMEDNPSDMLLDHFYSEIFQGHPLELPILGTRKSLGKIDRASIIDYFCSRFRLNDMVISAAGNIRHSRLVELIKHYPALSGEKDNSPAMAVAALAGNGSRGSSIYKGSHRAVHMCLGGPGCDRNSRDRHAISLFTNLLGGSMSSRLFQRIREEEGLAYSISASNIQYMDTGLVFIYSASSAKNVKKILRLITGEIDDIRKNGIKPEELERARENMKGNIVLAVEDISSRMFRLGKTLLFDKKVLTIDQILKKIDLITVNDLNNVAQKYFDPETLSTIILGKDMEGIRL